MMLRTLWGVCESIYHLKHKHRGRFKLVMLAQEAQQKLNRIAGRAYQFEYRAGIKSAYVELPIKDYRLYPNSGIYKNGEGLVMSNYVPFLFLMIVQLMDRKMYEQLTGQKEGVEVYFKHNDSFAMTFQQSHWSILGYEKFNDLILRHLGI